MLAVSRFVLPTGQPSDRSAHDAFLSRAAAALAALRAQPGYLDGRLGRSVDDPSQWVLVTRWTGVGAYRRALGAWRVRTEAHPFLFDATDEPSAFEVLLDDGTFDDDLGTVVPRRSDRADDPPAGR